MIVAVAGRSPRIDAMAFIAEDAMVIGDVHVGAGANIRFQSIVRGDTNSIRIGAKCNIQDAIAGDVVYILEANPGALRTAPLVSKVTGVRMGCIATQVMLGGTIFPLFVNGIRRREILPWQ